MSNISDAVRLTWASIRIDGAAATMTGLVDEIVEHGPMGASALEAWDAAWDRLAFETNRPADDRQALRFDDAVETIEEFRYLVVRAGEDPADDRAPWVGIESDGERIKGLIELIRGCRPNHNWGEWTQAAWDASCAELMPA